MIAERTETSYQTPRTSSRYPSPYENSVATLSRPTFVPTTTTPDARPQDFPLVQPRSTRRERGRRPMGRRGPLALRLVRTLSWHSPMTLAVVIASFCVTVAAIYISAYARVSAESLEETRLDMNFRLAYEQHIMLAERVSQLSVASHAVKTAGELSMVPNDAASQQLLLPQAENAEISITAVQPPATVAAGRNTVALTR